MIQLTKRKDDGLVGLEIEAGSIAAAEVRTNGSPRLSATAIAPLPAEVFHDGEVADPEALAEELRAVFSEHRLSRRVRLGIASGSWCEPCACRRSTILRNSTPPSASRPRSRYRCRSSRRSSTTG